MFDGRHCNKRDLDLFVRETDDIRSFVLKDDNQSEMDSRINSYLKLVERFDKDICEKLKTKILFSENSTNKIIEAIDDCSNELKQNIIVDIYEH